LGLIEELYNRGRFSEKKSESLRIRFEAENFLIIGTRSDPLPVVKETTAIDVSSML